MTTCMRNPMRGSTMPSSGTTKEASGVAHTTAEAATDMSKVPPKAIHQTLRPSRCNSRPF